MVTYGKMAARYYWPTLSTDINKYVRKCRTCAKFHQGSFRPQSKLGALPVPDRPFQHVAIDVLHFTMSNQGNNCVLMVIDALTRWVEAIPMPNELASTTAKAFLTGVVARHGCPEQILTDQGPNFMSRMFASMCKMIGAEHIRTTAYHPHSNGMVERVNKTITTNLKTYVSKDQRDWDQWLDLALFNYRTALHSALKDTPFFLLYGRDALLPLDVMHKSKDDLMNGERTPLKEQMVRQLKDSYKSVRQFSREAHLTRKERYDKTVQPREFRLFDLVLVDFQKQPLPSGQTRKLAPKFRGPYRIIELISQTSARVVLLTDPRAKSEVIAVDRFKLVNC